MGNKSADTLLDEMDKEHNGTVSWDEFRQALAPFEKVDGNLSVGTKCLVYDNTFLNSWMPCEVTKIDEDTQAVQVSTNPGHWYSKEDQEKCIRKDDAPRSP